MERILALSMKAIAFHMQGCLDTAEADPAHLVPWTCSQQQALLTTTCPQLCVLESMSTVQAEESALRAGRMRVADGAGGWPAWNHGEFRVRYASLAQQLCIAGIYIKLLLDGVDQVCFCVCTPPHPLCGAPAPMQAAC